MDTIIKIQNPSTEKWENADQFTSGRESVIALTFETNPIGELKHRQSDLSNLVKLPKTTKNRILLGFAEEISEAHKVPYRRIQCRVYVNGVPIFKQGSYFRLMSVTPEHYEINIFSGITNLFNQLSESKLRDLPRDSLGTIAWSTQGLINSIDKDICIPIMDWNVENNPAAISDSPPSVNVGTLLPCVKLPKLIDAILSQHDYSLETDLINDNLFLNTAIPCVLGAPMNMEKEEYHGVYQQETPKTTIKGGKQFPYPRNGSLGDKFFTVNEHYLSYSMPITGTYTFKVTGKFESRNIWKLVIKSSDKSKDEIIEVKGLHENYSRIIQFETNKPDVITFEIYVLSNSNNKLTVENLKIECIGHKANEIEMFPNPRFPIVQNLPDINQLDLIKQFLLMFGQMVYIDHIRKKLVTYGWEAIYRKIDEGKYLDWSDKISNTTKDIKFSLNNYGQESIIKYKENEYTDSNDNTTTIKSEGKLRINNQHLDKTKDLFELPASSIEDINRFGRNSGTAKIRCRPEEAKGEEEPESNNDVPFCVVHLEKDNNRAIALVGDTAGAIYGTYASFNQLQAQNLVDKYYKHLAHGIMRKCRIYTEEMNLSASDIAKFNHRTPIYLKKYDKYFYVNKIDKFQSGKLTSVELVYLPPVIIETKK